MVYITDIDYNFQLTMLCRAAFEIVALAAGRLGELPLAAQSVIMTTDQSQYPPSSPIPSDRG